MRGRAADGHAFIDDAVRRGAVAVVAERPAAAGAVVITVPSTRRALAELGGRVLRRAPRSSSPWWRSPAPTARPPPAILVEGILQQAGHRTGVIGTIDYPLRGPLLREPGDDPRVAGPAADPGGHARGRGDPRRAGGLLPRHRSVSASTAAGSMWRCSPT
ncbi:MAG: Mur ligase domain-containing protein [Desulfobacterales bacterium]|nr:Mur ligase domain-containing protein [Desulfobacterales bacterium]